MFAQTAPDLWNAISTVGLATVLLIGVLFGIYKIVSITVIQVLVPLVNAHVNFLNVNVSNMEKISKNLDALNQAAPEICKFKEK